MDPRVFDETWVTGENCQLVEYLVGVVGSKNNVVSERITTVRDQTGLAATKTIEKRREKVCFHVGSGVIR